MLGEGGFHGDRGRHVSLCVLCIAERNLEHLLPPPRPAGVTIIIVAESRHQQQIIPMGLEIKLGFGGSSSNSS